jgi:hypothetical protein
VKFTIESASAKVRDVGPVGDEDVDNNKWSGVIPLALKASAPVADIKFDQSIPVTESVTGFEKRYA